MATRKPNGQFEKGHRGGPGRPKGVPKEREYLNTFRQHVPLERWGHAVDKMLEMAIDGNVKCFEALAKYCLPQPAMLVDMGKEMREAFRMAGQQDQELMDKMAKEVIETFKLHHGEAA